MMEQAKSENGTVLPSQTAMAQMATRHRVAAAEQAAAFDGALRSAFARMANDWPGLGAQVLRVTHRAISVAEVADFIEPGMFLAMLDGVGDNLGVALICPTLLSGLVEGVATGRVVAASSMFRQPTRTDAALLAPMIDVLLRQISDRCSALPLGHGVQGFVYGSFLHDPRPLPLLLEDGRFRLLSFDVALGQGAIRGTLALILPDGQIVPSQVSRGISLDNTQTWTHLMQHAVNASPTQLDVVLFQSQLSLSTALSLGPGDTLCIPLGALEALSLRALDGTCLGTGRLGQARGQRAVRLTCDLGPITADQPPRLPKATSLTPVIRAKNEAAQAAGIASQGDRADSQT